MISLWMCANAKYPSTDYGYITCSKGHDLGKLGRIHSRMARKGRPLVCRDCQQCPDADIMGEDIPKEERGW